MHLTASRRRAPSGFSIIEVLVTIVVVSVALLGVAKMQAASVSNTQVARTRSLVALQAESLASLMHGNQAYWASPALAPTALSATGPNTGAVTDCSSAACGAAQMFAYDWKAWVNGINAQIPTYAASVACTPAATPVTCLITITWSEKSVAINSSTASAAAQVTSQPYTLLVTP
jgi:type IV pilus assembly protein PilV